MALDAGAGLADVEVAGVGTASFDEAAGAGIAALPAETDGAVEAEAAGDELVLMPCDFS